MITKALRQVKPLTKEDRQRNEEKTRRSLESYKRAARDIQEICASRKLDEPVIIAESE